MKPRGRLKNWEIEAIREAVHHYDSCAEILLFGSRTDLEKRGGDIDLLVVSKKIGYNERRKIRVELLKRLGNRKIDLLVVSDPKDSVFTDRYGVKL